MELILTIAAAVLVALAAAWIAAVLYSRSKYPYLSCRGCNGSGRKWEARVLYAFQLAFLWRARAYATCPACGGNPQKTRR